MSSNLHIPGTAVAVVIDLPFLASEINDAHRQVIFHGKSMLANAAEAGRRLLQVKGMLKHGEFKAWVEKNCECSYRSAAEYMQVAKNAEFRTFDPETSINAFLEACATPRAKAPEPAAPAFDWDDAAHALKLHAMATRGATEGERDVALRKLDAYAKSFGHTAEELVVKAQGMLPNADATPGEAQRRRDEARISELEARLKEIEQRTAILNGSFRVLSKEQLVELCINLTLKAEGYFDGCEKAA